MSAPPNRKDVATALNNALEHFSEAVSALKGAEKKAAEAAEAASRAAKKGKDAEKKDTARRLHDEVHAVEEEAYDVFTQLAGLEVRTRMPLDTPEAKPPGGEDEADPPGGEDEADPPGGEDDPAG